MSTAEDGDFRWNHFKKVHNLVIPFQNPEKAIHMTPYVSELKALCQTSVAYCENEKDQMLHSYYAHVTAVNALVLANYYMEVDLCPPEVKKYASIARKYYEICLDENNTCVTSEVKEQMYASYYRALSYGAYFEYYENGCSKIDSMSDMPRYSLYAVALDACSKLSMGRKTKDVEKIQTGLLLFELFDKDIEKPAKTKFLNMVIFVAYHDCISMMEQNAVDFPGLELCWEKSRIISCLQKAIRLLNNKPFITSLQNMLDKYTETKVPKETKASRGTTDNLFFWEAKCGSTKQTFYPRFDLGADDSWVLTYGVKELPTGQQVSSAGNSRLDLSRMRDGPQYKCPWCGNKGLVGCGYCGKLTCYNDRDRHSVCAHCGKRGRIGGSFSGKDMEKSVIASGSGQ